MGPDSDRTSCTPCLGNTFSITGTCLPCDGGQAANANKTQCEVLGQAKLSDATDALTAAQKVALEAEEAVDVEMEAIHGLERGSPVQAKRIKGFKVLQKKASAKQIEAEVVDFLETPTNFLGI